MIRDGCLRLLADCMLGRLAKWLRILGYDTAYENDATDHELARRARAEGRLLLTCDRELATRRGLNTLLIQSQQLDDQVQQVQDAIGPPPEPSLSRCPVCNVVLEEMSAPEAADRVPRYVLRNYAQFRHCPGCGRVYWRGSHVEAMGEQLPQFEP
jgi:uncharacterized protein with PIN domain